MFPKIFYHMGKRYMDETECFEIHSWIESLQDEKVAIIIKIKFFIFVFLIEQILTMYYVLQFSQRSSELTSFWQRCLLQKNKKSYFLLLAFEKRENLKLLGHPLFNSCLYTFTTHSGHIQVKRDGT